MLGDYDAVHVRRGDILKTRKDRFGVLRSRHPHVERDTKPECMLKRIAKWVPSGRTLFIASNERKPGYFSPLGVRYLVFVNFLQQMHSISYLGLETTWFFLFFNF